MTAPVALLKEDEDGLKHFTRRIAVRDWRPKGWRTLSDDNYTESEVNDWCVTVDVSLTDSIDVIVFMMLFLWRKGRRPKLWQRDVRRAFRSLANYIHHLDYMHVTWRAGAKILTSCHIVLPPGSVSAV